MIGVGFIQSGCFGSFALTSKVHEIVKGIGPDDKVGGVIRTLIMYAGYIVPVWGVSIFVDVVILNLIEFWTGSNPLAMQEGEMEQQYVTYQGEDYLITATKNQFKFEKLSDGQVVEESFVQYCNEDQSWSYIQNEQSQILTAFHGLDENKNAQYEVFTADGSQIVTTQSMGLSRI